MNSHSAVSSPNQVPSLLVIGYGNPTHGDDAIGSKVTSQIQALELKNVKVCTVKQLTPELSSKLAATDYAIFVHACCMTTAEVQVNTIDPFGLETGGSSTPGLGHSLPPCSLLALTHSVYGHSPQSWWVKVAGQNFETGHQLSYRANQNIPTAVEQIEVLMAQFI